MAPTPLQGQLQTQKLFQKAHSDLHADFLCRVPLTSQSPSVEVAWVHSVPAAPSPRAAHVGTALGEEHRAAQDGTPVTAPVAACSVPKCPNL